MRWLRTLGKLLAWLAGVLAAFALAVFLYSDWLLRAPPGPAFAALPKGDPVAGLRTAQVAGCPNCHGADLGGQPFIAIPDVVTLVAPDLTGARSKYDDAGLLRLLRAGVKADGEYALGMPHFMQQRLTDREAANVIAFVRSLTPAPRPEPRVTQVFALGRLGLVLGKYQPYVGDTPESPAVLADRAETQPGRHLALIACAECHGKHFEGNPEIGGPALAIAKAYSPEQFARLMRTGITLAGTESRTGLMTKVARARFTHLEPGEVDALYAWLTGPGAPH